MKIIFLSVDDEYAGAMQSPLFDLHPEWVKGSVISSCRIYKKTTSQAVRFLLAQCGWTYVQSMLWIKMGSQLVPGRRAPTPSRLAKKHGVPIYHSANINDEASLRWLAAQSPDLVISTNFNHYVGGRARSIAKIGTWNLHKSYLPHYRGMAPGFYALLNGEPWSGATLHVMDAGFDTGDIIQQVKVPIRDGDTVFALNSRIARAGGKMLAALLDHFDPEHLAPAAQPPGEWPTYSYPSREDLRRFRSKALEFDRWRRRSDA
jgi:methionyl-tRNA formyltransferase